MAEQKGIITGIGNTITPEIDAVINDFIVNGNTIIKGFENQYTSSNNTNVLSAGMCQFCGYRGVLPTDVTLVGTYVYGKFVLHFDNSIEDEFYIEASNTNRRTTTITGAGTYYLKLYANGVKQGFISYPDKATFSDIATNLDYDGTIGNNVTAVTQPINDNSTKVATTEYVKNQIENDIGYKAQTISILADGYTLQSGYNYSLKFEKKANYVLITYNLKLKSEVPLKSTFEISSEFRPSATRRVIIYGDFAGKQIYIELTINATGQVNVNNNLISSLPALSDNTRYAGYKL